jgi:checkpoint serine/threonine-protein kinase
MEKRMMNWDAVFKNGDEWSFEEVRARERGLLGKAWREDVKEWESAWHLPGCESFFRMFPLHVHELIVSIHA